MMEQGAEGEDIGPELLQLGPAERAAARATVDGLKCMAVLLEQHEVSVGALLAEMGREGEGQETLQALAMLAGVLHKVGYVIGRGGKARARVSYPCWLAYIRRPSPSIPLATHSELNPTSLTHTPLVKHTGAPQWERGHQAAAGRQPLPAGARAGGGGAEGRAGLVPVADAGE